MSPTATLSLTERVQELIASDEFQLPAMPDLAVRLRDALDDPDVSRKQLVDLMRGEPAITTTLLRTVNSPALGFMATTDLSQAISLLGLRQVRAIVTAVLVQGQFDTGQRASRQTVEVLWSHAIASATVARHLAKTDGYPLEEAFLGGLLHGIGRLIVMRALDQLAKKDAGLVPGSAEVDTLIDAMQHDLGHETLWSWNLSEDICEAARAMSPTVADPARPIVRIVRAADLVVQKLGMHPLPDPDVDLLQHDAFRSFGVDEDDLPAWLDAITQEIAEVKATFSGA